MKNFRIFYMGVIGCLAALSFSSCQEEDEPLQEQQVQFGLNITDPENSNGRQLSDANDFRHLLITIKDASGNAVLAWKELSLYDFGGKYMTEPITLKPGTYTITNYAILDSNKAVTYATPREESQKAYLVTDPLPVEFTVMNGKVTEVSPEILPININSTAQEFGYATFTFEEAELFHAYINAFALNNYNKLKLTEAELVLYAGQDENNLEYVGRLYLQERNNLLTFSKAYKRYGIKITKPGYDEYYKVFAASNLSKHYFDPLKVILIKQE